MSNKTERSDSSITSAELAEEYRTNSTKKATAISSVTLAKKVKPLVVDIQGVAG